MFKVEKNILDWVERNLMGITAVVGTIFSIWIRYMFRDIVSGDYRAFLEGWYDQIYAGGGIKSLDTQVGNYNFLYQFCIAVMTYIPIKSLYAYKILSVIFDLLLAVTTARMAGLLCEEHRKGSMIAAYFMVLFSPITTINSSAWAQCDSIYVFWAVAALYGLLKERYVIALLCLGMSFAFKLQAVFILPFFLFVYFAGKKFSIIQFLLVPGAMLATELPILCYNRSIFEIMEVYLGQTNTYTSVSMNYPSFWTILFDAGSSAFYEAHKPAAMLLTVVILAALMIWWIERKIVLNSKNLVYMAFLCVYTCVLFLPQMHERYGYLYEILAILLVLVNKKTIKLMIPLYMITLITYGHYLFGLSYGVNVYMGIANTVIWFGYIGEFETEGLSGKINT